MMIENIPKRKVHLPKCILSKLVPQNHFQSIALMFIKFVSYDRSSYSDAVLLDTTVLLSQIFTQSIDAIDVTSVTLRGGIKKKTVFFSEKLRKGGRGVSPNPKFPYQKKLGHSKLLRGGGGLRISEFF